MAQANKNSPSQEQIERRAYEIYLQRGGTDGFDIEDWNTAEQQLKSEMDNSDPAASKVGRGKSAAAHK
jgi:hypothetical protein